MRFPDGFAASAELLAYLQRQLDALESGAPGRLDSLAPAIRDSLPVVFAASDFVAQACIRDADLLSDLIGKFDLTRRSAPGEHAARAPAVSGPDADMLSALRRWRRREMVRIAWRALAGWAEVEETLADLSDFADAAIRVALEHARQGLAARYGEPRSAAGAVQPLVVFALGKLGGGELNFSSDIDLVLLFPEHGESDGAAADRQRGVLRPPRPMPDAAAETPTHDGYALRVDLRLRPFGDSGPLVASFAAMEQYYQREGRDWERYAWIKARPVAGDGADAEICAAAAARSFTAAISTTARSRACAR